MRFTRATKALTTSLVLVCAFFAPAISAEADPGRETKIIEKTLVQPRKIGKNEARSIGDRARARLAKKGRISPRIGPQDDMESACESRFGSCGANELTVIQYVDGIEIGRYIVQVTHSALVLDQSIFMLFSWKLTGTEGTVRETLHFPMIGLRDSTTQVVTPHTQDPVMIVGLRPNLLNQVQNTETTIWPTVFAEPSRSTYEDIMIYALLSAEWVPTNHRVRCDSRFRPSGCVNFNNPGYLKTMTDLPDINKNIAEGQRTGSPGAYGGVPLHRLTDSNAITRNRYAACISPAKLATIGNRPEGAECDEYPFAATYEGGGNAHIAWVPAVQNRQQGGRLSTFYNAARIVDGDPYYVKATE